VQDNAGGCGSADAQVGAGAGAGLEAGVCQVTIINRKESEDMNSMTEGVVRFVFAVVAGIGAVSLMLIGLGLMARAFVELFLYGYQAF